VEHDRGGARRHPAAADPESSEEDATVQGEDVRKRSRKNFRRQRRSAKGKKSSGEIEKTLILNSGSIYHVRNNTYIHLRVEGSNMYMY
jgi:hypothetical protein